LYSLPKLAAAAAAIGVAFTIYSHFESGPSSWSGDTKDGGLTAAVVFLVVAVVTPLGAAVERRRAPDGRGHHELLRLSSGRTGMLLWLVLAPLAVAIGLAYDPNTPTGLRAVLAAAGVAIAVVGLRFATRRWQRPPRWAHPWWAKSRDST